MKKEALGSLFDDFLEEESLLVEADAVAIKRAMAFEVGAAVEEEHITETEMDNT